MTLFGEVHRAPACTAGSGLLDQGHPRRAVPRRTRPRSTPKPGTERRSVGWRLTTRRCPACLPSLADALGSRSGRRPSSSRSRPLWSRSAGWSRWGRWFRRSRRSQAQRPPYARGPACGSDRSLPQADCSERAGQRQTGLLCGTLRTTGQTAGDDELVPESQFMRLSQARGNMCPRQIFVHKVHRLAPVRDVVHGWLASSLPALQRAGQRESCLLGCALGATGGTSSQCELVPASPVTRRSDALGHHCPCHFLVELVHLSAPNQFRVLWCAAQLAGCG